MGQLDPYFLDVSVTHVFFPKFNVLILQVCPVQRWSENLRGPAVRTYRDGLHHGKNPSALW